eukprot:470829-Prorocentrum_minimum.AAC.3
MPANKGDYCEPAVPYHASGIITHNILSHNLREGILIERHSKPRVENNVFRCNATQNILVSRDSSPSCAGNSVKPLSVHLKVSPDLLDVHGETKCEVELFVEKALIQEDEDSNCEGRLHGDDDDDWYCSTPVTTSDDDSEDDDSRISIPWHEEATTQQVETMLATMIGARCEQ